jgi:hypothetical protein
MAACDYESLEYLWYNNVKGKQSAQIETCSATLSATNPTWTPWVESREKPASDSLRYGKAC